MLNQNQIDKLATYFYGQPVHRAYLFGSVVRGENTENSDIDILIELDYNKGGADFSLFISMREELATLLGYKIDLVSANGLSPFIAPYIESEKRLVYERG